MNVRETAKVLAKAAAFDQRTVGEADIMAWHEVIADLDAEDALSAVSRWYRDSTDRLMPATLRKTVGVLRAERFHAAKVAEEQERLANGPERPAAVRFDELPPDVQGAFRGPFSGPAAEAYRQAMRERFGLPPVAMYGGDRHPDGSPA